MKAPLPVLSPIKSAVIPKLVTRIIEPAAPKTTVTTKDFFFLIIYQRKQRLYKFHKQQYQHHILNESKYKLLVLLYFQTRKKTKNGN